MTAFWILAPIMVMAALGMLFVRKAVHAAMLLAIVMLSLSVLYLVLDAPFLFATQIIVYTGAILMLFLFVLMLVGVDASDSVVETIKGQRFMAILGGLLLGSIFVIGLGQISLGPVVGLDVANANGNIPALADILFGPYVFTFEVTSALLITAAARRHGARPPRAARAEADTGEPGRPAAARLRRLRQAPRPAADAGRLRPSQRGRHPRAAARRHGVRGLRLAGAGRARHGPLRPGHGRRHRRDRAADRRCPPRWA